MRSPFRGSYPALPTPMRDGELDLVALDRLVWAHVEHASAGICVCGTTGESSTLTELEHQAVLERAVAAADGRLQVIAGVGTNSTQQTQDRARRAEQAGVDGLLVVTPYYNKPSARGLLSHFDAVAEACDTPIVLYNVPSRTGCDLGPELVGELASRHENVVAIKEASDRVTRVRALAQIDGLGLLCGEDGFLGEFLRCGGHGTISVVANIAPDAVAELVQCVDDPPRANQIERALAPLCRALFVESNPVPLKQAMQTLGWCSSEVRLPLAPLEDSSQRTLAEALDRAGDLLLRPTPVGETS